MSGVRQSKIARGVGLVAALVAVVCVAALIADHVAALSRLAAEERRVEALGEQAKTNPEMAAALHDERERQTHVSLAREARNRGIAWVLLAAGSICVACGKWYMAHRPQPLPALDTLVTERFAPALSGGEKAPELPAVVAADGNEIDRRFVDDLVERFGGNREAAIPILQAIQSHYRYLPDEALQHLCRVSEITAAQIVGTSTFYAQFRRSPVGERVVRVCHGTACHVAGAEHITQELHRHLEIPPDQDTDPRRLFTIDAVACLGCCSLAPVMTIEQDAVGHLSPSSARQALDALAPPS